MVRIAVCDDEELELDGIAGAVGAAMKGVGAAFEMARYESARALLDAFEAGARWDALFLDILLGGVNGVDVAADLRRRGCEAQIVFVTVAAEFALDGYRVFPAGYLVKPIARDNLLGVVRHLLNGVRGWGTLAIPTRDGGTAALRMEDIAYVEVYGRELLVHMRDGRALNCLGTLSEVCEALSEPFLRCHRCYAVNMACVRRVERYQFALDDGTCVPIAQRGYPEARARLLSYLSGKGVTG